jgi:hypothetical protein
MTGTGSDSSQNCSAADRVSSASGVNIPSALWAVGLRVVRHPGQHPPPRWGDHYPRVSCARSTAERQVPSSWEDCVVPPRMEFHDPPGLKTCRWCRERKALVAFRRQPRARDGLQSYCRACERKRDRPRREREKAARRAIKEAQRPPEGYKLCCRCSQVLATDRFTKNRRKRDGLEPWCRDCERARKGAKPRWVDPAPEGFKTCARCSEVKPLDAFYQERWSWGRGVTGSCRQCLNAAHAARRRKQGIAERPRFDDPEGFKTCRRCRVVKPISEFGKERRNSDGLRSWCDVCQRARTLEWHRANPTTIFRLKALRRSAEERGSISDRDWLRLLRWWDHSCAYCGATPPHLHIDHVIPISRGGQHSLGNVLPACRTCNSSRSDRLLVEWRYGRANVGRASSLMD